MKKILLSIIAALAFTLPAAAQSVIEDFESNSLEWTECTFKDAAGTAIINKGVMTITSKGENKTMGALLTAATGVATRVGQNTFFETHCYAPLDPLRPFTIVAHVTIEKLGEDKLAGFVFNYRDSGTFYCFAFNEGLVNFIRRENGEVVGSVSQSVKWERTSKLQQTWELRSDGQQLIFLVDDMMVLKVKYMPITYSGVGFYTFGKQKLVVEDIEFIQN